MVLDVDPLDTDKVMLSTYCSMLEMSPSAVVMRVVRLEAVCWSVEICPACPCTVLVMLSSCKSMLDDSPFISFSTWSKICSEVLEMVDRVSAICRLNSWVMGPAEGYSSSRATSPGAEISGNPLPSSLSRDRVEYTPLTVTPSPSSAAGSRLAASAEKDWYW